MSKTIHSQGQLGLLQGDSLAKTLVMRKAGQPKGHTPPQASTANGVACGAKCAESSRRTSQSSWSLKTSRHSQQKVSTLSYTTLPRSGTMRNGVLCQPLSLVRRIYVKESGLWLTPTASDGTKRASFSAKSLAKRFDTHPNGNLAEQYAKFTGKRLCPNLLEYMMGYPGDYTMLNDYSASETP